MICGYSGNVPIKSRFSDFGNGPAFFANQKMALMSVRWVRTADKSVEGFNPVHKSLFYEKIQGTINGRRGNFFLPHTQKIQ